MLIKQISVFVDNKVGALSEICGVLVEHNIDIRVLSIADTTDFGILRLIVNDPVAAYNTLKERGYTASITKVISIETGDQPGGLAAVLKLLYDNTIHIEYMYAFVVKSQHSAYSILRVENTDLALDIFQANGIKILCASDLYLL